MCHSKKNSEIRKPYTKFVMNKNSKESTKNNGKQSGFLSENPQLKNILFFAGSIVILLLVTWGAFSPSFDNKEISMGDMEQVKQMNYQTTQYAKQIGKQPGWAPNLFGGMPNGLGNATLKSGNYVHKSSLLYLFGLANNPFHMLFVAMLGMFVLLRAVRIRYILSICGAIAYAFMTFSISSIEAGHVTKVLAMGAMPGAFGGLLLIQQRKYLLGAAVLALFTCANISFFHYQITYYMFIALGMFGFTLLFIDGISNNWNHKLRVILYSVLAIAIAPMCAIGQLKSTNDYSKTTMRNGSQLSLSKGLKKEENSNVGKNGLDITYAFAWSYSPTECLTMAVPRFKGGSTGREEIDGEIVQGLYHGELSFTSGPVYIGAGFILLFILGFLIMYFKPRNSYSSKEIEHLNLLKTVGWASLIILVISIILAMGRFFPALNNTLFNILPYYNKFRTPMMALCLAQVVLPLFGLFALNFALSISYSKEDTKILIKRLAIATGVFVVLLFIAVASQEYTSTVDKQIIAQGEQQNQIEQAKEQVSQLKEKRKDAAYGDLYRSIFFILGAFTLLYLAIGKILNSLVLQIAALLLLTLDLFTIAQRYLVEEIWVEKTELAYAPTLADQQVLKDNKNNARVYDLRNDPYNSNNQVVYHRSIGGYHPAKMSRIQELITYCYTKKDSDSLSGDYLMNNNSLDMMNCKYILFNADNKGGGSQDAAQIRPKACGNAWFVNEVKTAASPEEVILTIRKFNPLATAILEQGDEKNKGLSLPSSSFNKDSSSIIKQTYFSNDTIIYESNNANAGFGVFSEVYYKENNAEWMATIDGNPVPVWRVNYVLRGLQIPAGKHKIEFYYKTKNNSKFYFVELISSIIILGGLAFALYTAYRKNELSLDDNLNSETTAVQFNKDKNILA